MRMLHADDQGCDATGGTAAGCAHSDWNVGKPALTEPLLIGLDATSAESRPPQRGGVLSQFAIRAAMIGPIYGNAGLGVPHGFVFRIGQPTPRPSFLRCVFQHPDTPQPWSTTTTANLLSLCLIKNHRLPSHSRASQFSKRHTNLQTSKPTRSIISTVLTMFCNIHLV